MADQTVVQQVGFAPQVAPYAERLLGKAEALTDTSQNPFTSYAQYAKARGLDPTQVAGFQDLQLSAMDRARNLGVDPSMYLSSMGLASLAQQASGTQYAPGQFANQFQAPGQYVPGQFSMVQAQAPSLQQYQMGPAQQVGTQAFTGENVGQYMSPYMQAVVDKQQREAVRQSGIAGTQLAGQATQSGAFGGSRYGLMEAERQRNLATQLGDIQATGSQAAFQNAQQQFNAQQQANLQAQLANQGAGLTVGGQNLQALLGIQQLGAGQNLQAQLANQQMLQAAQQAAEQSRQFGAGQGLQAAGMGAQYGQAAQQLGEQSRQFGAGLGLQGLQAGMGAYGQLAGVGQNIFGQQQQGIQTQQQLGQMQQQQRQAELNVPYQDYLAFQNYPYKQLQFMSDITRGTPTSVLGSTMYQSPPSMFSQLAGAGTALIGANTLSGNKLLGLANGGAVDDPPAGLQSLALAQI